MYRIEGVKKRDQRLRWELPDRVFFACGACHILAYAFLEKYKVSLSRVIWLEPDAGFTGNHILIASDSWVFDHHGYFEPEHYFFHTWNKARRWWPGWNASQVELPPDVLISETKSREYGGLRLKEPKQFLYDAIPRAQTFLTRFQSPPC